MMKSAKSLKFEGENWRYKNWPLFVDEIHHLFSKKYDFFSKKNEISQESEKSKSLICIVLQFFIFCDKNLKFINVRFCKIVLLVCIYENAHGIRENLQIRQKILKYAPTRNSNDERFSF